MCVDGLLRVLRCSPGARYLLCAECLIGAAGWYTNLGMYVSYFMPPAVLGEYVPGSSGHEKADPTRGIVGNIGAVLLSGVRYNCRSSTGLSHMDLERTAEHYKNI